VLIRVWSDFICAWLNGSVKRNLPALWLAGALVVFAGAQPASAVQRTAPNEPAPLLAYYSIADDAGSWNSKLPDVPLLGRYSGGDKAIIREHVRLAKQAGIEGFIVSWRNTPKFNTRLEQLLEIADGEDFKLAISYQGLDAQDHSFGLNKVEADLDYFVRNYTGHAALTIFGKPVIIWSGTWEYLPVDVASVTGPRRQRLLILASARSLDEYQRVADSVDGNAYYWSSANPETDQGYSEKLADMGQAVHSRRGLWIAPAAPGFELKSDGRSVDRNDGATLRRELEAATASTPDAIGLISWNVFSDNTHVEPSVNYGTLYLEVLADLRNGGHPVVLDFDSSEPGDTAFQPANLTTLGGFSVLFLVSLGIIMRRNRGGK
jgi:hypothetical protein